MGTAAGGGGQRGRTGVFVAESHGHQLLPKQVKHTSKPSTCVYLFGQRAPTNNLHGERQRDVRVYVVGLRSMRWLSCDARHGAGHVPAAAARRDADPAVQNEAGDDWEREGMVSTSC